jgi:hypothetical protein
MAAFYTAYQDCRCTRSSALPVIDISNAAAATAEGVEVEVAAAAGRGVQLAGNAS